MVEHTAHPVGVGMCVYVCGYVCGYVWEYVNVSCNGAKVWEKSLV